jgi:RHH-type proline utilization regulon transcriptional repressor/proline dehydrogenase/delta 1-pyrroline-5-carboxylate dehydrogenase
MVGATKGVHSGFKEDFEKLSVAVQSYLENYENEFDKEHDYFKLRGEDNIFRYLPLSRVALRVTGEDSLFEVMSRILAAKVSKVSLHVSIEASLENAVVSFLFENKEALLDKGDVVVREDEKQFVACFKDVQRVLYADESRISDFIFEQASKIAKFIVRAKPLMDGRLELLNFFQEQSISHSYHRYGNIGARAVK